MSFTDGVGEKERNSTKISQLNLQGLFYFLARQFYILPDVLLFLFLWVSITAYPSSFSSLAARYLFLVIYCLLFILSSIYFFYKPYKLYYKIEELKMLFVELNIRLQE